MYRQRKALILNVMNAGTRCLAVCGRQTHCYICVLGKNDAAVGTVLWYWQALHRPYRPGILLKSKHMLVGRQKARVSGAPLKRCDQTSRSTLASDSKRQRRTTSSAALKQPRPLGRSNMEFGCIHIVMTRATTHPGAIDGTPSAAPQVLRYERFIFAHLKGCMFSPFLVRW